METLDLSDVVICILEPQMRLQTQDHKMSSELYIFANFNCRCLVMGVVSSREEQSSAIQFKNNILNNTFCSQICTVIFAMNKWLNLHHKSSDVSLGGFLLLCSDFYYKINQFIRGIFLILLLKRLLHYPIGMEII